MIVDGLRRRAAWTTALAALVMVFTGCGLADDVLAADDSTE